MTKGSRDEKSYYKQRDESSRKSRYRSESEHTLYETIQKNIVTFAVGPAGTGKTYIATLAATDALASENAITKVILIRPAVEAGENLGFLPGTLSEKLDPWLSVLYDQYHQASGKTVDAIKRDNNIVVESLAYMRGKTFNNSFIVLDEAQNTTNTQMKMVLTRIGEDSKLVIAGDSEQDDLPKGVVSGLRTAIASYKGDSFEREGVSVVEFSSKDIVRSHIVKVLVEGWKPTK